MSQPSFTNFIVKRPWLKKMMTPMANWYANAAGYRKLGLRYDHSRRSFRTVNWASGSMSMHRQSKRETGADVYWIFRADDLIPEESETVLLALKRLPANEAYDRVFRLRRAFQVRPYI
jgi:ubiquinol-cytochrome c reductase subunit 7